MASPQQRQHAWSYMQRAILRLLLDGGPLSVEHMRREFRPETINSLKRAGLVGDLDTGAGHGVALTEEGIAEIESWGKR